MIDHLDKMFKGEEWNISFAGCGFSSLYYLGALSCILEHAPHLVRRASKIGGASSGCLVAASLVVGIPIETCCEYVMSMALAARRHQLSVLHPAFSLLGGVQDSLLRYLPPDAHLWASGRLCVSLTRLSDGENLLVTEFDNREELIQVLLCSCFFPLYCGVTPPSYRGVRYMDGALSNNMPLHDQRNTITVSPFCGEADICPREGGLGVLAVHYGNLGIRVSQLNVKRIYRSFFPPEPAELAEMSHNGYMDALRFLRRNDHLGAEYLSWSMPMAKPPTKPVCCAGQTPEKDSQVSKVSQPESHWWLEQNAAQSLPASIQKVLCKACRESHYAGSAGSQGMAPPLVRLLCFLLIPFTWSVELIVSLISVMMLGWKLMCSLMSSGTKTPKDLGPREHAWQTFCSRPEPPPSPGAEDIGSH
ncbi:patatin-like phospholipase domain-containing protein 2 isoform X1 [Gadus chalcogrammus]|uniref:patatin-like phospholipase domain-containing protein 2 isoform X1 n=1 Tax=Gadus chalcogrammus TaxID=1042646 RepID=UPI0024C4CC00|nr:patatin-like phospholipase domain-containing protein 2 isoform X1 [Gadus chalcogrammus]